MEDTDDDDFLSQVAQAELEALSASNIKRRKITTVGFNENQENTNTTTTTIKVKDEYKNEGDYMAALKGSKSTLWQQRIKTVGSSKLPPPDYNARGGGGSGAVVPEKVCPCGLGVCNVFTANTERNRGRDFYKCPQRQESGGCGFFQWCDESPAENNGGGFGGGGSHGTLSNSVFPELQCSCGAGSCLILTSRKGDNNGKQFYKCPENQTQALDWVGPWAALITMVHASGLFHNGKKVMRELKDKEGLNVRRVYDGKDAVNSEVFAVKNVTIVCVSYAICADAALSDSHVLLVALQGGCGFFKWCDDNTASAGLQASAPKCSSYYRVPIMLEIFTLKANTWRIIQGIYSGISMGGHRREEKFMKVLPLPIPPNYLLSAYLTINDRMESYFEAQQIQ
ncbi:hypothetical protein D5086_002795 [Populus alba]|uniref:Uncharacterized protein n=1 Tax=Populus alba TaxID=43335 RepID=A0ACC4D417_POPAL